jgi:hypothetical protein
MIDHYKYISGVKDHLAKRASLYREKGLGWWKQSQMIVDHIANHEVRRAEN